MTQYTHFQWEFTSFQVIHIFLKSKLSMKKWDTAWPENDYLIPNAGRNFIDDL